MSTPPQISSLDAASDPVCGGLVTVHSEFRADYYGKDLYFCSEKCLELFLADPDAYESEGTVYMSGGLTFGPAGARRVTPASNPQAAAQTTLPPKQKPAASPPAPGGGHASGAASPAQATSMARPASATREDVHSVSEDDEPSVDLTIARLPPRRAAARKVREAEQASGSRTVHLNPADARIRARAELEGGGLLAWFRRLKIRRQERKAVTQSIQAMLGSFRKVSLGRSALDRHVCYRDMLIDHFGNDEAGAERLLSQASDSFASWPRARALTLRDVVQFASILEYLADHPSCTALTVDVGELVADLVRADL